MALIDLDYAKDAVTYIPHCEYDAVQRCLENCPTIEAKPIVYAHWEDGHCSRCGAGVPTGTIDDVLSESDSVYCWCCGAKMEEV